MKVINGDSLEILKTMDSNSVEALITDPPYGLSKMSTSDIQECLTSWLTGDKYEHKQRGFMGKKWDSFVPSPELWKEVYRVMRHGAHGLVFAGSRTQDLMSISLRLAGFEIRDTLMWVYGSGFPKSHNISKAIDKSLGHKVSNDGYIPNNKNNTHGKGWGGGKKSFSAEPTTEQAKAWKGWGTALKPAYEPIILVRKPPSGSIAQNVLEHGCGGINIDATRIQYGEDESGRFPANVMINDHIDQEEMKRYFYCAKASKKEREAGLDVFEEKIGGRMSGTRDKTLLTGSGNERSNLRKNTHPTVKPLDLMRYLVKLITPPNGTALDPFCGSGSTLCALALENMEGIGIELSKEYCEIAEARIKHWEAERKSRLL